MTGKKKTDAVEATESVVSQTELEMEAGRRRIADRNGSAEGGAPGRLSAEMQAGRNRLRRHSPNEGVKINDGGTHNQADLIRREEAGQHKKYEEFVDTGATPNDNAPHVIVVPSTQEGVDFEEIVVTPSAATTEAMQQAGVQPGNPVAPVVARAEEPKTNSLPVEPTGDFPAPEKTVAPAAKRGKGAAAKKVAETKKPTNQPDKLDEGFNKGLDDLLNN